jgi:hypothetical protein
MINLIETLFGLGILCAIIALVLWLRRRRANARRFGWGAAGLILLALGLELYVRIG